MKRLTLITLLCLLALSFCKGQTFESDFDTAKQLREKTEKPILLVFSGSDWCKPCIVLKKNILNSDEFSQFSSDHLVVLNLDFPFRKKNQLTQEQQAHNDALADRYNPEGVFPLVLLLNEDNTVAKRIEYKMSMETPDFIAQIQ